MKAVAYCLIIVLLLVSLGLSSCAKPAPAPAPSLPEEISMGTHALGGNFNAVGTILANCITDNTPMRVLVKPFGGPCVWMPLLNKGEIEIGIVTVTDITWSFNGDTKAGFTERAINMRYLLPGGRRYGSTGLIVRDDSDIKTAADLKGKRVASGYGTSVICHRLAEALLTQGGLSWDDVVQVPIPEYKTGLKALREGRVDACFGGNVQSGPTLDVNAAIGVHPLSFGTTPKDREILHKFVPGAEPGLVKAGTGIAKEDAWCYSIGMSLLAYYGLSDDAAYEAFKVIWNNCDSLQPLHKYLKTWNHEAMVDHLPGAPYHPGAIRFYKEKGLWTEELEQKQKQLMKKAK